ncbi:hypothetical protein BJ138DRAFT_1131235 [Hygrophoropsis aurantiaca]|uniref:Uncharacterized protein n=1 Tax=Hygrophoropsis aurantiaca TaxID=72124 RepID=A0ACB7ZRN5_9AGAM|nr:hypothetical protein BJ138DRAFT_1131235 [Hygrophoropsis aurantiaca]
MYSQNKYYGFTIPVKLLWNNVRELGYEPGEDNGAKEHELQPQRREQRQLAINAALRKILIDAKLYLKPLKFVLVKVDGGYWWMIAMAYEGPCEEELLLEKIPPDEEWADLKAFLQLKEDVKPDLGLGPLIPCIPQGGRGYKQQRYADRTRINNLKKAKKSPNKENVSGANGKVLKEKVRMSDGQLSTNEPQSFYFPPGHEREGVFIGMVNILAERGFDYNEVNTLRAECPKSRLELACEARGFQVLFLLKFHCELNFIEQCWGYAKRVYREFPPSSSEADLERNIIAALDSILVESMRR